MSSSIDSTRKTNPTSALLTHSEAAEPNNDYSGSGETVEGSHSHVLLYCSHFLSTWNSRSFEFGAVLFLASIFPGTLLPLSIYALVRAAAAIVLSPAVGGYIDQGNRLRVIRTSIGKCCSLRINFHHGGNQCVKLILQLYFSRTACGCHCLMHSILVSHKTYTPSSLDHVRGCGYPDNPCMHRETECHHEHGCD
jgi:hypothetical protein